jgi:hypothetical protein
MSKLLYIPTGSFLHLSAFNATEGSPELNQEELTYLLNYITSGKSIDKNWAKNFNVILPLLPEEVEVIP